MQGTSEIASTAEPDSVEGLTVDGPPPIQAVARDARAKYEPLKGLYEAFARSVAAVLTDCLGVDDITVHSITHRAKDAESFERKAAQPSPLDPSASKYADPMKEITDKAGVRVITYFLSTVDKVSNIISNQFSVLEKVEKISEPDRLGYQSTHLLISYSEARVALPEYKRFAGLVAEVQVRTILQHAWAEIEHDVQYKAVAVLPSRVRRRFAALAGLIEIADREFQAIENEDRALREEARRNVDLGQLDRVEITADSLRAYLNRKYGEDRRMSDFSYEWTTRLLIRLGFTRLSEVEEAIGNYNDDSISRIIWKSRQGQLARFEEVLLASMGERFILAHPWLTNGDGNWYIPIGLKKLAKLRKAGVRVGEYRPSEYPETLLRLSDLESMAAEMAAEEEKADAEKAAAAAAADSDTIPPPSSS